jgi:hypothetical protein
MATVGAGVDDLTGKHPGSRPVVESGEYAGSGQSLVDPRELRGTVRKVVVDPPRHRATNGPLALIPTTAVPLAVALHVLSLQRLRALTRGRTGMAAEGLKR